jgi:hypothetical protein
MKLNSGLKLCVIYIAYAVLIITLASFEADPKDLETTDAERDDARFNQKMMRLCKLPENFRKSDDEIAELTRASLYVAACG